MKIVCDACGAKYSIADEKVSGKVFKIRCKRCSNIIVVRGTEQAADAGAAEQPDQIDQKETRVFDYSGYDNAADAAAAGAGGAVWHVVIDQEQVGPLTVAEVTERFRAGQLDADSYVWQEGFADWERLADVAELAVVLSGAAAAPADDGAGMFGGPAVEDSETAQNDPADLFAAAAHTGGADPGADLFAGGGAASPSAADPASAGGQLFGSAPAEAAAPTSDQQRLKGQRNENSVLFSLSNLASLAGDSAGASSSPTPSTSTPNRTTATQEGSGLIDIRSMAQVYLGNESQSPAGGSSSGSLDDLPSFGASAFGAPASPMLLPTAPAQSGDKKLLYILLGVIGVLAIAAIVLVVIVVSGGDKKAVAAADTADTAADTAGAADEADPAAKAADDEVAKSGDEDPEAAAGGEKADDDTAGNEEEAAVAADREDDSKDTREAHQSDSSSGARRSHHAERSHSAPTRSAPKREEPKSPPPSTSAGCDEVTCLVEPNKACCKKYRSSGASSSKSNSNLKERPTKSDVKAAIAKVMGRVNACKSKYGGSGIVKVRVKVSGSGSVSSATASPSSPLGSCAASAVRRARFPKTQNGVTFTYPFRF